MEHSFHQLSRRQRQDASEPSTIVGAAGTFSGAQISANDGVNFKGKAD